MIEIGDKDKKEDLRYSNLSSEQLKCASILNKLYSAHGIQFKAEDLILGAIYAAESWDGNPDWKAQSGNSLRELLYPMTSRKNLKVKTNKELSFANAGFVLPEGVASKIGALDTKLNALAHHGLSDQTPKNFNYDSFSKPDFDSLMSDFVQTIQEASEMQIDVHKVIKHKLSTEPKKERAEINTLRQIIGLNNDAKDYFFYKVDHTWLDWLYTNGFLDVLKEPALDISSFSYRTPEISYFTRIADIPEAQKIVADIVVATPISKETFNPEVVDQFFWICTKLSAKQLVKIIPKIHDDEWLRLLSDAGYSSARYAFGDIFKTLTDAEYFDETLLLAQEILAVAPKVDKGPKPDDLVEQMSWLRKQKTFHGSNIADTGVFGILGDFPDEQVIKTLELLINTLTRIIELGDKNSNDFFDYEEANLPFSLYGTHFFDVKKPQERREFGSRDDIDALFTTITWLINRIYTENADSEDMRQAWDILETVPDSEVAYKIKLFTVTRRPAYFANELKKLFFKLFETKGDSKNIYTLLSGSEYHEALKISFDAMEWKSEYKDQLFTFFSEIIDTNKGTNSSEWFKDNLRSICSTINKSLTPEEITKCAVLTGEKLIENFDPESTRSGQIRGGNVVHEPPISAEELDKIPFSDLMVKIKDEWSPEKIEKKEYWETNRLLEYGVRGLGDYLTARVQRDFTEALTFAPHFFDPKSIHSHYTSSFFKGVKDTLKKDSSQDMELSPVFELLKKIREHGIVADVKIEKSGWLEGWTWTYDMLAEVVGELVTEKSLTAKDFIKRKTELLETIEFLFNHPNPSVEKENEDIEKVASEKKQNQNIVSFDPISTAINSVRGRTFEAFVNFIYRENKINGDASYLSNEVKGLYIRLLKKENSRAIMAMFGRYFSVIYFRDKKFAISLLSEIFPTSEDKKKQYRAAWGGFLTTNLFTEIFHDESFQPLYKRWLENGVHTDEYERYEHDPDKRIAIHLALAYIHFDDFTLEHELFTTLWSDDVPQTTKKEFISFIGGLIYGRANEPSESQALKLEELWNWVLENIEDGEIFKNFGTWIKPELFKDINGLQKRLNETLIKSEGELNIDYRLAECVKLFAENDPDLFLDIAENHFLRKIKNNTLKHPLWIEKGWQEAIRIAYENPDGKLKIKTEKLISHLIRLGGREFWPLEDVIINKRSSI